MTLKQVCTGTRTNSKLGKRYGHVRLDTALSRGLTVKSPAPPLAAQVL